MSETNNVNLSANFQSYFQIRLAKNQPEKEKVYGIRYRVFGEEFEYEPLDKLKNKMEIDDYDYSSFHCLLTHIKTNTPAACVRLIPAISDQTQNLLPFEQLAPDYLNHPVIKDSIDTDRSLMCEISRFAVDGAFRRRSGEKATRFGLVDGMDISKVEQRSYSLISIATALASVALSNLLGKPNMFAMMEPFLPRILKKSGIIYTQIGSEVDYHGLRAPFFAYAPDTETTIIPELRELYAAIFAQLKDDLNK